MISSLTEYLIGAAAILLIYLLYCYNKFRRIGQLLKHFPSPNQTLRSAIKDTPSLLQAFHEIAKEHGTMVHLKLGFNHSLLCSDHKFLEFLLSNNHLLKKASNLAFLEPWIGTGLVTADGGPKWKLHRKLITPAFHFKILEQFVDVFESVGNIFVQKLSKESGKESVDIYPYVTRCTLDIICETAMGTKVDTQSNAASSYFQSTREMCKIFVLRTMSLFMRSDFLFWFSNYYKIQKNALKVLHGYTQSVIDTKRKELIEKKSEENQVDDLGRKKKKAFLDSILEANIEGQVLSDKEIREEVDTFMFAGHDTTGTAISFILYCLAQNSDIQKKVFEEQEQILGDEKNPKVTYTHLQEMKYLENVIKETLRLYPPVSIFGRHIHKDVEYNGKIIPKGVGITVFVRGLHMNPDLYPNPEKFDPSRFENMDGKHPFAFIPFSAGPRNCIGQKYAMLEMKSLVGKVVRNFELLPATPEHKLVLAPETVLKSLNGVKISLKLRQ